MCTHGDTYTCMHVLVYTHGGGGTACSPIFKYVDEQVIDPVACVVLTDLCCDDFGDAPQYPVLWVSTEKVREQVPFGETVEM